MATIPRSSGSGSSLLNLDGAKCGFVRSVDGGGIHADVVVERMGPEGFTKKHIGQPKYEDFTLQIGFSMAKSVYDWIAATWNRKVERKSGSIVTADFNFNAVSERQFFNALITAVTIPALDGSSKEPAYLTLKFAPEYTKTVKGSGKVTAEKSPAQKQFVPSNFRFELDGLDCSKVSKIDAFTVVQTVPRDDVGGRREPQREPVALEFPNLRVTLAGASAGTWNDWFEDFVIKGNSSDSQEKSGAVVFLSPNRTEEIGRVTLGNVGIFGLRQRQATGDQVARVVADLYCERMELAVGGAQPTVAQPEPALAGARRLPDLEVPPRPPA